MCILKLQHFNSGQLILRHAISQIQNQKENNLNLDN